MTDPSTAGLDVTSMELDAIRQSQVDAEQPSPEDQALELVRRALAERGPPTATLTEVTVNAGQVAQGVLLHAMNAPNVDTSQIIRAASVRLAASALKLLLDGDASHSLGPRGQRAEGQSVEDLRRVLVELRDAITSRLGPGTGAEPGEQEGAL